MVVLNDLFKFANDESYHIRNIPKTRGPDLTKYEQVIYECEEKYGKKPTWCCVYGALRDSKNIDIQRIILLDCKLREDPESDKIRLQITLDVLHDPLMHYDIKDEAIEVLNAFDHLISVLDVVKEIYMNTDDGDFKRLLSETILRRNDKFLNKHQCLMYTYTSHWANTTFNNVMKLTEKHVKENGKDIMIQILQKLNNTPYVVPKTKRLVKQVLESELFV